MGINGKQWIYEQDGVEYESFRFQDLANIAPIIMQDYLDQAKEDGFEPFIIKGESKFLHF